MTTVIGALLLAGWLSQAVGHLAVGLSRCPTAAALLGPGAAREAAERRAAHRLRTGRTDAAGYRSAMQALADLKTTRP